MSGNFDVVVIGGGHNGLTAATTLAKAGRRTLLLERDDAVGGLARREEFHPGYRDAGLLFDTTGIRPEIVKRLELSKHGLEWNERPDDVLLLGDSGSSTLLKHDDDRWAGLRETLDRWRPALRVWTERRPPDLVLSPRVAEMLPLAAGLRRLGRREMLELLRVPPMALADFLRESLQDELIMAGLALPALSGTTLGPRSPGSAANFLLSRATDGPGIRGGAPALIDALASAARSHGVEIRTNAPVERVLVGDGRARGVVVDGGEILGGTVVATCDPRTVFLQLVGIRNLDTRLAERIGAWRCRGTTARVRLALRRPLTIADGAEPVVHARIASSLDAIERAADAVKYGCLPDRPVVELHQSNGAASGHAVVSALTHFVGAEATDRSELANRVIREIEHHAGSLREQIVHADVQLPRDIESTYGVAGGQIHHGEHALDQLLVRPAPGCTGYDTPVKGLWLAGSGSHPGGGLTCAPGFLAASAIARA